MNNILEVFILSLVPTFEGRYAIVYSIGKGYPLWETLLAAGLGVLLLSLVLPMTLPYIDRLMLWLEKTPLEKVARLYLYYIERVRRKAHPYVEKWGFLGLTIFVAIPLPGTGVWTGALAAYLLDIEKRMTVPALILGGLLSMAITLVPSLGIFGVS
ncbi:ligand-binding protein SH3 [Thermococcus sp. M36]|uniref:COG2426 family protein n=1 Tax=unclassified Thermococcus TaxID=2627626 RepID=UPI00143C1698|nr:MULTISPECIES: COG2426 family protein [unclassified Thermococcus]NJD99666.1 ligand-binding protein SH3 [Thermococcus sp. LS1]NJE04641.1 ligand-binding protein SH3 [Thermococcus sp. M36]